MHYSDAKAAPVRLSLTCMQLDTVQAEVSYLDRWAAFCCRFGGCCRTGQRLSKGQRHLHGGALLADCMAQQFGSQRGSPAAAGDDEAPSVQGARDAYCTCRGF